MNKLRIIFYGTPEFATHILDGINHSEHTVVAIVTAPDKPAGRGRKIQESDVKKYGVANDIPVLQPTNLKAAPFIAELEGLKPDLQVIVAFRMLPQAVWSLPLLGTFNLHASLLPQYRGAAPINWAIINNEETTGVTTFFIDEKIDTGAVIDQLSYNIKKNETAGSLYNELKELGKQLTLSTINTISTGTIDTKIQNNDHDLKEAPKLTNSNMLIYWSKNATAVDAHIRGLNPYPTARAILIQNDKEEQIKIHQARITDLKHKMQPGNIVILDDKMLIAAADCFIEVLKIQLPNKKPMTPRDLFNGYSLSADARMAVV